MSAPYQLRAPLAMDTSSAHASLTDASTGDTVAVDRRRVDVLLFLHNEVIS